MTSTSRISEVFNNVVAATRLYAEGMHDARAGLGPATFFEPIPVSASSWSGDLFDLVGMESAFSREELYQQFFQTYRQGEDPGKTGDVASIIGQGDFVSAAQRAYQMRHSTPIRDKMHASARDNGHSAATGVLAQGIQGHFNQLERRAKS